MHHWILLLGAGILCGFLNAAASSGAAISLPLLLALGLPPVVANGTNRLPVLVGMVAALWTLHRGRAIPWLFTMRLLPVFLAAAFAGAGLVALLPMDQIRLLVSVAVFLAFLLLLLNPNRWLHDGVLIGAEDRPSARLQLAMACVGLWTGLIVIDAGIYLLMSLVLIGGLSIRRANAVKVVLIAVATMISLVVFIRDGDVDWASALPLMLGSALGGRLGGTLALVSGARIWIYRLLVLAISLEVVSMLWMWVHPSAQPLMM